MSISRAAMSSLFLDRRMGYRTLKVGAGLLFAATLARLPASAAEYYVQPIGYVEANDNSNLDLTPGVVQQVQGYIVDAAALTTIATQNSSIILRPRLVYGDYPKSPGDDRLEAYLDINGTYRTQLSTASLTGSIQRQDLFNAEVTSAVFNDVNPTPTPVDTGKAINGATRDSVLLYPKYIYSFSPVIGAGFSGEYQAAKYTPSDDKSFVNYNYYEGGAFVRWSFTPLSAVTLGGYGSRYDATQFTSRATGSGATLDVETNWTPVFTTEESVSAQHTVIDDALPTQLNTSVNTWGAGVSALYTEQASQFRLSADRTISPWGGGSLYVLDRLQAQYTRTFNPRLSFTGAVLAAKTVGLTSNISGDNRTYVRTTVNAKWFMTRTFFVQGGYQYAFQKYQVLPNSADDNQIYIRFGYQGLPLQR
jgi:hypothetical protein